MRSFFVSSFVTALLIVILLGVDQKEWYTAGDAHPKFLSGFFVGFGLCAFCWMVSFKRQTQSQALRRRALLSAGLLTFFLLCILEYLGMVLYKGRSFQVYWTLAGILSIGCAFWAFRLLYRKCY